MKKTLGFLLILVMLFSSILPLTAVVAWADEAQPEQEVSLEMDVVQSEELSEPVVETPGDNEKTEQSIEITEQPTEDAEIDIIEHEQAGESIDEPHEAELSQELAEEPTVEEQTEEPLIELVKEEPAEEPEDKQLPEKPEVESIELLEEIGGVTQEETEPEQAELAVVIMAVSPYPLAPGDSVLLIKDVGDNKSINDHTIAYMLWSYGDTIYLAVKSTHQLDNIQVQGVDATHISRYTTKLPIVVGGISYLPDGLKGNVNDSRWSVAEFPIGSLNLDYNTNISYYVDGIGNGHDVNSIFQLVMTPLDLKIVKEWVGGIPSPAVFTVQGWRNETLVYTKEVTLNPPSPASITIQVPKYSSYGNKITHYTIIEKSTGNYLAEITSTGDVETGYVFNVKNTYVPPLTDIIAIKAWVNGPSGDHTAVKLELYRSVNSGTPELVDVDPEITGEAPTFTYTWKDLPSTDQDGNDYEYSVKEFGVVDGFVVINGNKYLVTQQGDEITNTYQIPLTDIELTKLWVGGENVRPESITVILYQDDEEYDRQVIEPDEEGKWHYTWKDIPLTDANGVKHVYSVKELPIPHFGSSVGGSVENGFTITNTYQSPLIDITVRKQWVGGENVRPNEITVILYQNNIEIDRVQIKASDNWEYTFEKLPERDASGTLYEYRLEEIPLTDFETDIDGYLIINKYKSPLIDVPVVKTWVGGEQVRPDSITIILYQNGKEIDRKVITPDEDGNWGHIFENVPQNDSTGTPYVYTVDELPIENFTKEIDGWTITNTYQSPLIDVPVKKVWVDGEKVLPDSITLILYQNGEEYDRQVVMPDEDGNWGYTWIGLPETDQAGVPYEYTVDELPIENFEKSIDNDSLTITNTYQSPKTDLEVTKKWVGGSQVLPSSITLILYRNGVELDRQDVTAEDNWSYTWKDLDVTDSSGEEYEYTIDEEEVENFDKEIDDDEMVITNTYVSPLIDVTAKKVWIGGPEEKPVVQFELLRGIAGETPQIVKDAEVKSPDKDGMVVWIGLPETDKEGNKFIYSVREVKVPDLYEAIYASDKDTGMLIVTNRFIGLPKIELIKSADRETFSKVGDVITYTITIKNTGDTLLENIAVIDPMFPDLELPRESLAPGESMAITFKHTVTEEDLKAGKVLNVAQVKADSPHSPDNPEVADEDEVTIKFDPPKPKPELPKTGMGSSIGLINLGLALLATTGVLFLKKKEDD